MADDVVTISSTTDSQEQVEAALADTTPSPEPEQQASEGTTSESLHEDHAVDIEPSEASEEEAESAAGASGEPAQEQPEETVKQHKPSRAQQRIEHLARELRAKEARIEELQRALQPAQPDRPKGPRARPNIDEYDDLETYRKDEELWLTERTQAAVLETLGRVSQQTARQREQQARAQLQSDWERKKVEAAERIRDFDEVALNPEVPVSDAMAETLFRHPRGADILYYLGQHPEESRKIAQMDAYSSVAEIGRLGVELQAPRHAAAPLRKPNRISKAPAPISPIRSVSPGSDTSVDALTNMSYDDFRRVRDAQEA